MKGANVLVTNDGQVKIAGETGTVDPLGWITDGSLTSPPHNTSCSSPWHFLSSLSDLGASKAYADSGNSIGMQSIRGSIFWMAPEVLKGTGYGRKAGQTVGSLF